MSRLRTKFQIDSAIGAVANVHQELYADRVRLVFGETARSVRLVFDANNDGPKTAQTEDDKTRRQGKTARADKVYWGKPVVPYGNRGKIARLANQHVVAPN